jgi:hypothetical protein
VIKTLTRTNYPTVKSKFKFEFVFAIQIRRTLTLTLPSEATWPPQRAAFRQASLSLLLENVR